jgi:SAM-dependent methyltransferase
MALAEGDPVSYCLDPEKAVKELARVVKPNSHVIVSVDSKYAFIPRLISEKSFDELSRLLGEGIVKTIDRSLKAEFEFQAFTPEELKALFEKCGLKVVRIIGKPVVTHFVPREKRDEIVGENFKTILGLEMKLCDTPSLVGLGGHLEAVGIKQGTAKHNRY